MDIDSSSDCSGDSFLEGPRRLLPSDIADILLQREVEPRVEEYNRDRDRDSDDPVHSKEDLLVHFEQDTDNNGSSSRLGNEVGSSTLLSQYYSATKACHLLLESNYETSADEETSAHYTSSSSLDTEFDLSDPDAGMDDAEYSDNDYMEVSNTSPVEQHLPYVSDNEEPVHKYSKSTKASISRPATLISREEPASKSRRISVGEVTPVEQPHPHVSDYDSDYYMSSSSEEPVRKRKTSRKKSVGKSRSKKAPASNSRKANKTASKEIIIARSPNS